MGVNRLLFPRPDEERLEVTRTPVDDVCPRCGSKEVARYPVANYIGPRIVVKCQSCFHHLAVEEPQTQDAWPPWQAPTRDWPTATVR